ncbi:MAG: PotD/PotF family extracellular solute-binding protein [Pseudobdellovibrionaceae bacterium]
MSSTNTLKTPKLFSKIQFLGVSLLMSGLCLGLTACTSKKQEEKPSKELNLAIWANYLSPEMQEKFTKETGIKLIISNYTSNEELLAKVQAGASGYDVAVPSDYMVDIMVKQGMLHDLQADKIPNKANLNPDFLSQEFDPENKYSLPYSWLTAGIAVHRDIFKGTISSWTELFANKELDGKISLLDDVREVLSTALKKNGYSVNTTKKEELDKAQTDLKAFRKKVKMFRTDTIDPLVAKEVAVAHAYSSDALQAAEKSGGKIEYILPVEGGTRSIDNLVILKNAKNVEAAHQLINFLLTPEANVAFVKAIKAGPVLKQTRDLLPDNLKNNPALFPPSDSLKKFERLKDLGETTAVYDRLWTELKVE